MDYATNILNAYNNFFPNSPCEIKIIYEKDTFRYRVTVGIIVDGKFKELKARRHHDVGKALKGLHQELFEACQDFVNKDVKEVIEA